MDVFMLRIVLFLSLFLAGASQTAQAQAGMSSPVRLQKKYVDEVERLANKVAVRRALQVIVDLEPVPSVTIGGGGSSGNAHAINEW